MRGGVGVDGAPAETTEASLLLSSPAETGILHLGRGGIEDLM